jgi:hypothetical protein
MSNCKRFFGVFMRFISLKILTMSPDGLRAAPTAVNRLDVVRGRWTNDRKPLQASVSASDETQISVSVRLVVHCAMLARGDKSLLIWGIPAFIRLRNERRVLMPET